MSRARIIIKNNYLRKQVQLIFPYFLTNFYPNRELFLRLSLGIFCLLVYLEQYRQNFFAFPFFGKEATSPFFVLPLLGKVAPSPFLSFPLLGKVSLSPYFFRPLLGKAFRSPFCPFPQQGNTLYSWSKPATTSVNHVNPII